MSYPYQYPPPNDQYGGYPPPGGQPPYGQPQTQGYPPAGGYPPPPVPPSGYPGSGYSQPPYGAYPPPSGQAPPPPGYNAPPGPPPGHPPAGYGVPSIPSSGYPGAPPSQYPPSQYPPSAPQYPPPSGQPLPPAPNHPGYNPAYIQLPPPVGQHGQYPPPQPSWPLTGQGHAGQVPMPGVIETYLGVPVPKTNQPTSSLPGFDARKVAEKLEKAMKGFGTDERTLTETVAPLDALQVEAVKNAFQSLTGKVLIKRVESEVSGYFEYALRAKLLGPVGFDCWLLERATSGAGTKENLLNEILLDRSNFEIATLKTTFRTVYNKDLTAVIRSELSGKTERLFNMTLVGNRDADMPHVDQAKVQEDVKALYKAGKGKFGTDEVTFCTILATRSATHLRAVIKSYGETHGRLSNDVKSEFSGHMEEALLYIVKGYEVDGYGVERDAESIYKCMEGMGTKDERLISSVMRAHWNQTRFNSIKSRFHAMYGKTLVARIRSEISGEYKEFMAAVAGESYTSQSSHSSALPPATQYPTMMAPPATYSQPQTSPIPPSHPTPPASVSHGSASSAATQAAIGGVAAVTIAAATSHQIPPAPYPPSGNPPPPAPSYPTTGATANPVPPPAPYPQPTVSHPPPQAVPAGPLVYLGVPIPPPPPNPSHLAPLPGFNVDHVYEKVRKAMKGFGTDEKALTEAIVPLDAFQVEILKSTFETRTGKPLIKEVEREVSGSYEYALRAKLLGPVLFDCWLINRIWASSGMDEETFIEVLLDRSNIEIKTLKEAFKANYNAEVLGVFRTKKEYYTLTPERLFHMALNQDREADGAVNQTKVEEDVKKLYQDGEGRAGTDEMTFCITLSSRSPTHLRALCQAYAHAHRRLSSAIKAEFSGFAERALTYIALGYENDGYGVERDAELIHDAMKGMGTDDQKLIMRIVRAHWNKPRFQAIKAAYERKYGESLVARVKKETSGDYKDFMRAIIEY